MWNVLIFKALSRLNPASQGQTGLKSHQFDTPALFQVPPIPPQNKQEERSTNNKERAILALVQVGGRFKIKHKLRFQSSVFFKIKITHCLETIYTRVTKNSCPGISIHRFVNYTHMVTSVLAKKFIGNIHKALEMYTVQCYNSIFKQGKLTVCYIHLQVDKMQNTIHLLYKKGNSHFTRERDSDCKEGQGRAELCTSFRLSQNK